MEFKLELLSEFGACFSAKGYKQKTVQDMVSDVRIFRKFCRTKGADTVQQINHKLINDFTIMLGTIPTRKTSRYYGEQKYISKKTIQTKVIAVKNFMKFLNFVYEAGLDFSRIEIPKCPIPKMEYLTGNEIEQLIDHIQSGHDSEETKLRNILFVKLAFVSGMRLSELLQIRVEDIFKEGYEITIVGKGDKIRPIYINQEIKDLAEKYIQYRNNRTVLSARSGHARKLQGSGEFLFIRHDDYGFGSGLSKSSIVGTFKRYTEELHLTKRITCHMLRHSYATTLLNKGIDIRIIQELMGHTSILTTQRYTHVTNKQLSETHYAIFG